MVNAKREKVQGLILRILSDLGKPVYTTTLVKLMYFIDYFHTRQTGRGATDLDWIWDEFGSNAESHEIIKTADALVQAGEIEIRSAPGGDKARVYKSATGNSVTYDPTLEAIIDEVLAIYAPLSVDELKQEAKTTLPFRIGKPGRQLILSRFERDIPTATEEDWARHQQERAGAQGKTVSELRAKYKLD